MDFSQRLYQSVLVLLGCYDCGADDDEMENLHTKRVSRSSKTDADIRGTAQRKNHFQSKLVRGCLNVFA